MPVIESLRAINLLDCIPLQLLLGIRHSKKISIKIPADIRVTIGKGFSHESDLKGFQTEEEPPLYDPKNKLNGTRNLIRERKIWC